MRIIRAFLVGVVFSVSLNGFAAPRQGLANRLVVGYQGWFGCPGDADGNTKWKHWFLNSDSPDQLTVEALPSTREDLEKAEAPANQCMTRLKRADGTPIRLFSSQDPAVVALHFRWMAEHGIDAVAAQRFVSELKDPALRKRGDRVMTNIKAAAEANNVAFYVVYDVSGADTTSVVNDIRDDWRHLANDLKLTASSAYLRDNGKAALQLWGFGFTDRPGAPTDVAKLIADLKGGAQGLTAATVVGGVPSHWRTLEGDSQRDGAWAGVYRQYDVISPWAVGRFGNDQGADEFLRKFVEPDLAETRKLGLRYMPVIFPGFSWSNLMAVRKKPGAFNQTPRRCGNFMWHQVANLVGAKSNMLYAAMFDEVDEGTALMPLETRADRLPVGTKMLSLNEDGCSLPDDWYLRVTGAAAKALQAGHATPKLDETIRP